MRKLAVLCVIILLGCSSTELVENWKNPDIILFNANKVLLVGMTNNEKARIKFENKLIKEFNNRGVEAMRSLDVFDVDFNDSRKTEKELDYFEKTLLDKDFDAILLTKIIGSENRQSLKKTMDQLYGSSDGFSEDYRRHQNIYYDPEYYDNYTVYNAETSLYCICPGKERSLIWRGSIDVLDPKNIQKTIDDYIKLIIMAMEEQDLIFRKEKEVDNEVTGL